MVRSSGSVRCLPRFNTLNRSDPDPEKEDFAISPRSELHLTSLSAHVSTDFSGVPDTPLAQVSSTNFWRSTTCPTSCAPISCVWRATPRCLMGTFPRFGVHPTTVSPSFSLSWADSDSRPVGYRCGNSASILEVGPGQRMYFNVFEAAPDPENRDGPSQLQQAAQSMDGKVNSNLRDEVHV